MQTAEMVAMLTEDIRKYEELGKDPALPGYVVRQVNNLVFHLRKLRHDITPSGEGGNTDTTPNVSRDPFLRPQGVRTGRFPRKSE